MTVAIVKYNAGNIQSVQFALERLGVESVWTDDEKELRDAEKVIFPGVGEAGSAMASLRESGLDQVLPTLTQPVLGICVALQLLCARSEENDTDCLGILSDEITRFSDTELKVPHMGWNTIDDLRGPLFEGVTEGSHVYFVHSYRAPVGSHTIARSNYGERFSAALQIDNFFALQFHAEKSGAVGEQILRNFLEL